jgi:hypothetical protein
MVRKINKLALQRSLVNIMLCQKLRFIRVQKMSWGIEISNIDLSYKKLCERYIKLWTMYGHALLKLCNFYTNLMDKNMFPHQFVNFLTKFRYYYNYYVAIWRNKFELSLEDIWIFFYIQDMRYNRTCESKNNFSTILKIVLEAHIVQLIIHFDKHTEIH